MNIIIPSNRISGEIQSKIVVDNKVDKVVIQNKIVSKQDNDHSFSSQNNNIENQTFLISDYYYNFEIASNFYQAKRVEVFYSSGELELQVPNENINGGFPTSVVGTINGTEDRYNFYSYEMNEVKKKSLWAGDGINAQIEKYLHLREQKSLTNTNLQSKLILPIKDDTKFEIRSISVGDEYTTIIVYYNIITKLNSYSMDYIETSGTGNLGDSKKFDATSINITLNFTNYSTTNGTKVTYGEGNNLLDYPTNELFQTSNTYNGKPIGEYVAKSIISIYKNGRKTINVGSKTNHLITSNNILVDGLYGKKFTLERKIYKPNDNIIPYYRDKDLKQKPFATSNGIPLAFKVEKNSIEYNGEFIQTLEGSEQTYFNINFNNSVLSVSRELESGDVENINNGDRVFVETLNVEPIIPYNELYMLSLNSNNQSIPITTNFTSQAYSSKNIEINSDTQLSLSIRELKVLTSAKTEFDIYNSDFNSSVLVGASYTSPITIEYDKPKQIRVVVTSVDSIMGTTVSNTFIVRIDSGENFQVFIPSMYVLTFYASSQRSMSCNISNSNLSKVTGITLDYLAQAD